MRTDGNGRESRRVDLQERDMSLMADLHAFGCMLRHQVRALHFGSGSRANSRLLLLERAGYVARVSFPLPLCMGTAGALESAFMLGPAGIPVVASRLGTDPAEVRRQQRRGTPSYFAHTVEIVQFYLSLREATKSGDVSLDSYLPERLCQHAYEYRSAARPGGAAWKKEVYKADSVFVLSASGRSAGFALEMDLGHVSSAGFRATVEVHGRYREGGLFNRRHGVPQAGALVVTTSAARLENLAGVIRETGSGLFSLTTFAELSERGALGNIWHAPSDVHLHSLAACIAAEHEEREDPR